MPSALCASMASLRAAASPPGGCAAATPSTTAATTRCRHRTRTSPSIAMDNRRIFLVAAVAIIVFAVYQTWMLDYGPRPEPTAAPTAATSAAVPPANTAGAPAASSGGMVASGPASAPAVAAALPKGQEIHVHTDVLDLTLETAGGDIRRAELIKYPVTLKDPSQHVR